MTDLVPVPRQSLDSRITYAKALAASDLLPRAYQEIGRASCRERVCLYV